jgi:HD-GYP domain-containing protein (c-di-GMP phosphodiesterase class II)
VSADAHESASLAELLCALSFASDTGMGQPMEHGLKTAYIGLQLAEAAGLADEDRAGVFYGALLKDAGCTACGTVLATFFDGDDLSPRSDCLLLRPDSVKDAIAWFWRHAPSDPALPTRIGRLFSFMTQCRDVMKEGIAAHCEIGEMFAQRLGLPAGVQQAIRFSRERWDGKGLAYGRRGADTPVGARVLHLAQVVEVAYAFGAASAARAIATERRGADFDPDLVGAFLHRSEQPGFWDLLQGESAHETVLAMKPVCSYDRLTATDVDNACEVLADFADVKARSTWNHSRLVTETAVAIGARMGLTARELARLRRAALVHDIGKAAVPVGILDKPSPLSMEEWERFRLHPYYTERVLSRVGPLRELAADASAHHETLSGGGYPGRLTGQQISRSGRILAVADRFTVLSRTDGEPDVERALQEMKPLVGTEFDPACYEALLAAQGKQQAYRPARARPTSGLTEREIEVLRLGCSGLTNREIAKKLVLSEKTVEHHFEHVYNKLGVTSRTAASVYAIQNGLAG